MHSKKLFQTDTGAYILLWVNSSAYFSEIGYDRYKFVVQVVMGEQKGEGVKWVAWCSKTSNHKSLKKQSDNLCWVKSSWSKELLLGWRCLIVRASLTFRLFSGHRQSITGCDWSLTLILGLLWQLEVLNYVRSYKQARICMPIV